MLGAFAHPAFAIVWTASTCAMIGIAMYDTASGWLMTTFDLDPFGVSLVRTATTLPIFLFTLPAGTIADSGWLHGLKIAAASVVAGALLGMIRKLTPDSLRATFAVVAAILVLALPAAIGQLVAIAAGALAGAVLLKADAPAVSDDLRLPVSHRTGALLIAIFFAILVGLPVVSAGHAGTGLRLFDTFYRVASLVFGGGHVVLPLLQSELVPTGLIHEDAFLAGYGAAQAVPGPLFSFSAYVGAIVGGPVLAAICLVGIYLPSFLLVGGVLPFWQRLRRVALMQAALRGASVTVNINTPDAQSFLKSRSQVAAMLARAVAQGNRNL